MNQNLDSRLLGYGECYAMKFTDSGKAIYRVQALGGQSFSSNEDFFSIDIMESKRKKGNEQQHTVTIKRKGNQLYAEPEHITINENDIVLWHTDDASINTFSISSDDSCKIHFDSAKINNYSVYSHAFGSEGDYHWTDAYGSKISGSIKVVSPKCTNQSDQKKWLKSLSKENLITINGNKVSPQKLKIMTGQTVVWAIEKTSGISITDLRLLENFNCEEAKKQDTVKGEKKIQKKNKTKKIIYKTFTGVG